MDFNNVYLGDCLQLIQELPDCSIDTVVTDLPYGIDYQSKWSKIKTHFDKIANDKKPFIDFIKYLPRVLKPTSAVYLFTRWDVQQPVIDELTKAGLKPKNVIIWDKMVHSMGDLKSSYGSRYESIVFASNKQFRFMNGRPIDIIECPRVAAARLYHPNEKPIPLLRKLISDSTPENGVVLDCTCGSGTTLIAAIKEKKRFVGFELDKKYYDITCKRIAAARMEQTLF